VNSSAETGPPAQIESAVDRLYRHRFPAEMLEKRDAVWKILCRHWFARYIPEGARVLEVAAGYCEFINNIAARERVAIDLNPETRLHAGPGVTVHEVAAERLSEVLPSAHFDTVFMSNFLEHCRSRDQMLEVLRAASQVLRPGGRLLILGPNFRYCYKQYFDFFDHHLPLTEKSVVEALQLAGFEIKLVKARTLPFTFKSRLPSPSWLVQLYLHLPLFWPLFGAQFFIMGEKVG
jgi:SAM-dependent methyltransferase